MTKEGEVSPKKSGKTLNKGGRPTKRTAALTKQAFKYLRIGLSERTACELCEIDFSTWIRWKQKDKGFATNIKKARSSAVEKATTKLAEAMEKDNLTAIIFFLKTRSDEFKYSYRTSISAPPPTTSGIDTTELVKAMRTLTKLSRNTRKVL